MGRPCCQLVLRFCSEGDNIPDGIALAQLLAPALELADVKWAKPDCWRLVEGSGAQVGLY